MKKQTIGQSLLNTFNGNKITVAMCTYRVTLQCCTGTHIPVYCLWNCTGNIVTWNNNYTIILVPLPVGTENKILWNSCHTTQLDLNHDYGWDDICVASSNHHLLK